MRPNRTRLATAAAAVVAIASPFMPSAGADITVPDWVWAPHVHVSLDGQAYCDNSHTTIKLWGTFSRDVGLGADVTFTNSLNANPKGQHTSGGSIDSTTFSVTFTTGDGSTFSKNGDVGVGGNPYISIGFLADAVDGVVPIGDRIFVARCVMGSSGGAQFQHVDQDLYLPEHASGLLQQLDCNQAGPTVSLGVNGNDAGLDAEVYLDNNKNKIVHEWKPGDPGGPAGVADMSVVGDTGYSKNDHADSAGGNPQVSLTWVQVKGSTRTPITGAPNINGVRCNKI